MKIIFILLTIVTISFIASGCATVEPWEREGLADPIMMFDTNPIEKGIQEHYIEYREGSAGATGAQSGGCGCG